MKLSKYMALGALLAVCATGAQANSLLIFNYGEQDQTLSTDSIPENDSAAQHSIDFLRQNPETGAPEAGVDEFADIEILLEVEEVQLKDLLRVAPDGPGSEEADVELISDVSEPIDPNEYVEGSPRILLEKATITGRSTSEGRLLQSMFFATDMNGLLKKFSPGQTIDENAFAFNYFDGFTGGTLYNEFLGNNDTDVLARGETAFVGFAVSFGRPIPEVGVGSPRGGAPAPELGFFDLVAGDVYFGFIELTRGSITPGMLGLNTLAGNGATVPTMSAVPLPAGGWLLLAGLGGLAALRRRR